MSILKDWLTGRNAQTELAITGEQIAATIEAKAVPCPAVACAPTCWRCARWQQSVADAKLARAAGRVRVIPAGTVLAEPVGFDGPAGDLYGPAGE